MKNQHLILVVVLSCLSSASAMGETARTQIPQGYEVNGVYQTEKYKVELKLDPTKPTVRQAVAAYFDVWDLSQVPPAPVVGATLLCVVQMPGMPGHVHNGRVHEQRHPQDLAGRYSMHSISLTTVGRWELVLQVEMPDGQKIATSFPFDVQDSSWPDNPNADNVGPRIYRPH